MGQERTEFFCASDELRNGEESRQFEGSDFLGGVLDARVPKPEYGTGMIVDDDLDTLFMEMYWLYEISKMNLK